MRTHKSCWVRKNKSPQGPETLTQSTGEETGTTRRSSSLRKTVETDRQRQTGKSRDKRTTNRHRIDKKTALL